MARKQCRLWWPNNLSSCESIGSDLVLFGWWLDSANSIDVVVAHAASASEILVHFSVSDLQELIHSMNLNLPMPLQEASTFCMLGHCAVDHMDEDMKTTRNTRSDPVLKSIQSHGLVLNSSTKSISHEGMNGKCKGTTSGDNHASSNCGCGILNQSIEPHREALMRYGNWIQLLSKSQGIFSKRSRWFPEFHHMHQNGQFMSDRDIHLVIYEPPTYSRHYYSMSSWGYCKQTTKSSKKPSWFNELHMKSADPNLEAVIWGLNCSSAATASFQRASSAKDPAMDFSIISRLLYIFWYVLAVFVASISAVIYVVIQLIHRLMRFGSLMTLPTMLQKAFTQTSINVHIRSCQFLYWPVFLLGINFREQSNVEYAHMAALRKHSAWSSIAIDIILGIVFGLLVLFNIESVYSGTLFVASNITNDLLRSGCVWLMGVPAGFKLNTEVAELLGMISLNAIQIFSTPWYFLGSLVWHFVKGLALSGIFLGLTIPAALCIDMLKAATFHIQTLHWLMAFLYSRQIHALASLWRLFRGRKWNPLRRRLDSYDYTVEQHVVGSLLFTPLLLLLPTTSVFYTFFTIMNATVCLISIMIEITISILHATPCAEIFLWVVRRKRFPSGIWLEIIPGYHGLDQRETSDTTSSRPPVVSLIHSNYATLAQIVAPSYMNLFQKLSPSCGGLSAYSVLGGQRIPSTLEIGSRPALPWMDIGCREYWRLCYRSVLACSSSP